MIQSADDSDNIDLESNCAEISDRYLPARMIKEAVYCLRLFYLMHVEGQFAHNAETIDGDAVHQRVDQKTDALASPQSPTDKSPKPQLSLPFEDDPQSEADPFASSANANQAQQDSGNPPAASKFPWLGTMVTSYGQQDSGDPPAEGSEAIVEKIYARSVTLASEALGVVDKLDLVEGNGTRVTPVDYKRGKPRRSDDGSLSAWKPDRVQICVQALVLRENGFECDSGVLYFNSTRQRVIIVIDQPLIEETLKAVKRARAIALRDAPPPPLINSPKCPKCSLTAICLPDETNRCRAADGCALNRLYWRARFCWSFCTCGSFASSRIVHF